MCMCVFVGWGVYCGVVYVLWCGVCMQVLCLYCCVVSRRVRESALARKPSPLLLNLLLSTVFLRQPHVFAIKNVLRSGVFVLDFDFSHLPFVTVPNQANLHPSGKIRAQFDGLDVTQGSHGSQDKLIGFTPLKFVFVGQGFLQFGRARHPKVARERQGNVGISTSVLVVSRRDVHAIGGLCHFFSCHRRLDRLALTLLVQSLLASDHGFGKWRLVFEPRIHGKLVPQLVLNINHDNLVTTPVRPQPFLVLGHLELKRLSHIGNVKSKAVHRTPFKHVIRGLRCKVQRFNVGFALSVSKRHIHGNVGVGSSILHIRCVDNHLPRLFRLVLFHRGIGSTRPRVQRHFKRALAFALVQPSIRVGKRHRLAQRRYVHHNVIQKPTGISQQPFP
eukprot:m.25182 g.25182  ORF g.25182 m.25182 type:complete len:389 (-) comp4217_c0_seq1:2794-3960(-)